MANSLLSILVDGETQPAVVFSAVAIFDANIQLKENGNLSRSINSIKLSNIKIVESKLHNNKCSYISNRI